MRTCHSAREAVRTHDHEQLTDVLVHLEHVLHEAAPGHAAFAFGVLDTDDEGVTLAANTLDVADVADSLVGFSAPAEWRAFGLVTRGRSRPIDESVPFPRPDLSAEPSDVHLAVVVARSGSVVTGLRTGDGPFTVAERDHDVSGRIPDACKRVLGLATPAPELPVETYFALVWVEQLVAACVERPGELTWADAVAMHAGAALVTEIVDDHGLDHPTTSDELLRLGQLVLGRHATWGNLRERAATLAPGEHPVDAEAATWMDDGMYSREAVATLLPFETMLDLLEPVARPEIVAGVTRTVPTWLEPNHPL